MGKQTNIFMDDDEFETTEEKKKDFWIYTTQSRVKIRFQNGGTAECVFIGKLSSVHVNAGEAAGKSKRFPLCSLWQLVELKS